MVRYVDCQQVSESHYIHLVEVNGNVAIVHSSRNKEEYCEKLGISATEASEGETQAIEAQAIQAESEESD